MRYWYTHCPRCKQEGELFIGQLAEGAELCFVCDECRWYCTDPEHVGDYFKGSEGYTLEFQWPRVEQIRARGWERYCRHSE
jgi:hypothetical protein